MGLFKVRRTTTPGLIPAGLTYGEMAVNLADRILYVGGTAENSIEIAGGNSNYRFYYQSTAPGLTEGYGVTGETGQYDNLVGSRWVDSNTGREYVYIGDGDQWYWFEPTGISGGAGSIGPVGPKGERGATGARGETGSLSGNYVSSINGLSGIVSLTAGTNVSIGIAGSVITISASGGSVETTWGRTDPTTTTVGGVPSGSTFDIATNAIQVLHQMLYPYVSTAFTSFSSGINGAYELGQTAGNGTFTANWATSGPNVNWIPNSAFIRYSGLASGTVLTGGSPTGLSASVMYPAFLSTTIGSTLTVQITGAQQQGSQPSRTATSQWWSRMYFGKSSNPDLRTQTFDVTGAHLGIVGPYTVATTSLQGPSISVTAGAGDGFFYLFIHDYYALNNDPPFFGLRYSGFPLAQDGLTLLTITNAQGHTATYKRYKSLNRLNDAITIDINPT